METATNRKNFSVSPLAVALFVALCLIGFRGPNQPSLRDDTQCQPKIRYHLSSQVSTSGLSEVSASGLLTVRQMKERMVLPCNYVHDGFYLKDSNEVLNQVYQSLMELDDDIIPVVIECGGHDGITKSQSLKSSRCLAMNTLLIEASPSNYNILKQTRSYDFTVNAALCSGESVQLVESAVNSGQTHIASEKEKGVVSVKCTSIDAEVDKLRDMLPVEQQNKLQLIFLVLDIEGHEAIAIDGIQKYSPQKVFVEMKSKSQPDTEKIGRWAEQHGLTGDYCINSQDVCYNFHPVIKDQPDHLKSLLYGARTKIPINTYKTSEASQAYMFYGK